MALKDEYHIIKPDYYNTGVLDYDERFYKEGDSDPAISSLRLTSAAHIHNPIRLVVDDYQKDPVITDFMFCDSVYLVLDDKLLDILLPLKLPKTQHFPVVIEDRKGIKHKNYFMWYIYHTVACLDPVKSEAFHKRDGAYDIEKIVLNNSTLSHIARQERLAFRMSESPDMILIHQSLKEQFSQAGVTGATFYSVNEWEFGKGVTR